MKVYFDGRKHINKGSKHRRYTLLLKSPQSKSWPEMPKKGELRTCFASRLRGERKEDMASIKKV